MAGAPLWRVPSAGPRVSRSARPDAGAPRPGRHADDAQVHAEAGDLRSLWGKVPWADPASGFTKPFENQVGFLAQRCDRTTVTRLMRVASRTVGRIIERVVARDEAQNPDRLDGLRLIGADELSHRKHHKYITIVTDQVTGRVVWSAEGKNSETLGRFFCAAGARTLRRAQRRHARPLWRLHQSREGVCAPGQAHLRSHMATRT